LIPCCNPVLGSSVCPQFVFDLQQQITNFNPTIQNQAEGSVHGRVGQKRPSQNSDIPIHKYFPQLEKIEFSHLFYIAAIPTVASKDAGGFYHPVSACLCLLTNLNSIQI
jgi:hypothetical protein